ncbi:MAG TPA: helix-turn-helix domain-containing protein [Pseudonocardiaceae bacterium]|nr:helix-turn-helix domain-containing protein [Pseudonocardiaceae bacterium]
MQTAASPLWGVHDVAKHLGVPIKTLYQWRQQDYGPKGRRVGRYLRYDPREVIEWVHQVGRGQLGE